MSSIVSPSRAIAFDILRRVEEDGGYASVLLADENLRLSAVDRSLAYELVLGTLRRRSWLDAVIAHFAGRRLSKIDPPVVRALRLGLYQIRFLTRIPPSAAVNESVNLVHRARLKSAAGLANAILRRALREPEYDPVADLADPIERLAIESSHPSWLLARWAAEFGLDRTRSLAHANNENPITAFRFTQRATDPASVVTALRTTGAEPTVSPLASNAWRISGAEQKVRTLAEQGLLYVQDEASQWIATRAAATHEQFSPDSPVLDVCAAPGSKASLMAHKLEANRYVVAGDIHEARVRTIRATVVRTGAQNLAALVYDAARALPFRDATFGTVLLDAPCSGTGTLRRNPEIRWRLSATDIAELAQKQQRILNETARTVKPGGFLFYSTCSIEVEENEEVIKAFLSATPAFRGVDLRETSLGSTNGPEVDPAAPYQARFWPQQHGCEGFFVAALKRETID